MPSNTYPWDRNAGTMVKLQELRPGDILLTEGKDFISSAIQFFDASPYSHSILFVGDDVPPGFQDKVFGDGILEADFDGITYKSGVPKIQAQEKWADVYRFEKNGQTLSVPRDGVQGPYPVAPVIAAGFAYRGDHYAFSHLIFLALLMTTRKIPLPDQDKIVLRTLLDQATRALTDLIDGGREVLVCSELVYRSFSEARPVGTYALDIDLTRLAAPESLETGLKTQEILLNSGKAQATQATLDEFEAAKARFLAAWAGSAGTALRSGTPGAPPPVPQFVTPKDIAYSPNVLRVGRLDLG